jgi:hypothetical protein
MTFELVGGPHDGFTFEARADIKDRHLYEPESKMGLLAPFEVFAQRVCIATSGTTTATSFITSGFPRDDSRLSDRLGRSAELLGSSALADWNGSLICEIHSVLI